MKNKSFDERFEEALRADTPRFVKSAPEGFLQDEMSACIYRTGANWCKPALKAAYEALYHSIKYLDSVVDCSVDCEPQAHEPECGMKNSLKDALAEIEKLLGSEESSEQPKKEQGE